MSLKGRGEALRGRSSETSSWVFAKAHSTLSHSPGSQLSQRLSVHEEPELDMKQCCLLVATSCNNTEELCCWIFNIHKDLGEAIQN